MFLRLNKYSYSYTFFIYYDNMQKIKMLVCDFDGTLVKSHHSFPSTLTIKLLKNISKKNVRLVLSSGRSYDYLSGFSRALGLDTIIISGDGSSINYKDKKINLVKRRKMPNPLRKKIIERFPELNISYWSHRDGIRVDIEKLTKKKKIQVTRFIKSTARSINYKGHIISYPELLDIGHQYSNKGIALKMLMKLINVKKHEVIAIGDYKNDIPMIKKVGLFIFIGNKTKHRQKHIKRFYTIEQALSYINTIC